MSASGDFSQGPVWKRVLTQALPLTVAQIVQLLYNIVDRIYIGHLPGTGSMALTGLGITFPVVTVVAAFTNLVGTGGAPLFAIARGEKDDRRASDIMGNCVTLLLVFSALLTVLCLVFRKPLLYLFGAGDESYVYADAYLKVYLLGTPFLMLSSGLNGFINAQGYPRIGMLTTLLGAVLNLILDPLFLFVLNMGITGAAVATVISQAVSCAWVMLFLTGKKVPLAIRLSAMKLKAVLVRQVMALGTAGFIMQATNCLTQVACNSTLQLYGGEMYVGVMTVLNSVREVLTMPIQGLTHGSQPVLGYNYGAKEFGRVRTGIRFISLLGIGWTIAAWALVLWQPRFLMGLFSSDEELISLGVPALRLYFFGFCFQSFQFCGQSVFQGLGYAKRAIFFSLLRKAVIVFPLTLLLPVWGFGVDGVFLAEPVSNLVGGLACYLTMYFTLYRKLPKEKETGCDSAS